MKINCKNFYTQNMPLKTVGWRNFAENDERKVFQPFGIKNSVIGDLSIELKSHECGYDRWVISLKNLLGKLLGYEVLRMNPESKEITGYLMNVSEEYRQKGFRFGEMLRLFSVIEMNENKSPRLDIVSRPDAVYFHSKYKFEPSNICFSDRDMMLKTVSEDSSFSELAKEAKKIIFAAENKTDKQLQRDLCIKTNALVQRYINQALLEDHENAYLRHPFKFGFSMSLSFENLLKNKDFFNNCFKKYGIDYGI